MNRQDYQGRVPSKIIEEESRSEFGQSALALDGELIGFEKLVVELNSLTLQSDKGFQRALTILEELNASRVRLATRMRTLTKALQEAQLRNVHAEKIISEQSPRIKERQQETERLLLKFSELGNLVREMDAEVARVRKEKESHAEKADKATELLAISSKLEELIRECQKIWEEARAQNMQSLEKNADALRKSLSAARNRIQLFLKKMQSSD